MFKSPFSFEGRIRRTEYGITFIIYFVAAVVVNLLMEAVGVVAAIAYVPMLWFVWAQGTKRCHDRGNSAWWQFIPFYGFWMLFADGDPYQNEYGADPKGRGDLVDSLLSEEVTVNY